MQDVPRLLAVLAVAGVTALLLKPRPARADCLVAVPEADSVTGCITVHNDVTAWNLHVNNGLWNGGSCIHAKVMIDRDNASALEYRSWEACGAGTSVPFSGRATDPGALGARILLCNSLGSCTQVHYEPER